MRKIILALAIIVSMYGCKPDGPLTPINNTGGGGSGTGTTTFQVTIDGTSMTFLGSLFAGPISSGGSYTFQIYGSGSTGSLQLALMGTAPITAGTYSENATSGPLVFINYNANSGVSYNQFDSATDPVTIVISSITAHNAQGTFKGTLYITTRTGESKALTSGVFNVNF